MNSSAHASKPPEQAPEAVQPAVPHEVAPQSGSTGLGKLAHKIHRNLQDYGWYITIQKSLAYLVRAIYFRQVYRIYRIDVRTAKASIRHDLPNFSFRFLTPRDLPLIEQVEEIAEWMRGKLMEEIASGQLCLVALDGTRVAGFNVVNLSEATLPLVNLKRELHQGCAWSEHVAVRKEYRKEGLGSELRLRIFDELRRRGFRRLYGGTLPSNVASLSLARSVGFTEIADIHYRKILSVETWRYLRVRG